MPPRGYDNVTLKKAVTRRIDEFIKVNDRGYTSRPQVVSAAVLEFIDAFYARQVKEIGLRDRLAAAKPRGGAGRARGRAR